MSGLSVVCKTPINFTVSSPSPSTSSSSSCMPVNSTIPNPNSQFSTLPRSKSQKDQRYFNLKNQLSMNNNQNNNTKHNRTRSAKTSNKCVQKSKKSRTIENFRNFNNNRFNDLPVFPVFRSSSLNSVADDITILSNNNNNNNNNNNSDTTNNNNTMIIKDQHNHSRFKDKLRRSFNIFKKQSNRKPLENTSNKVINGYSSDAILLKNNSIPIAVNVICSTMSRSITSHAFGMCSLLSFFYIKFSLNIIFVIIFFFLLLLLLLLLLL
jgi:hypothetical protein